MATNTATESISAEMEALRRELAEAQAALAIAQAQAPIKPAAKPITFNVRSVRVGEINKRFAVTRPYVSVEWLQDRDGEAKSLANASMPTQFMRDLLKHSEAILAACDASEK